MLTIYVCRGRLNACANYQISCCVAVPLSRYWSVWSQLSNQYAAELSIDSFINPSNRFEYKNFLIVTAAVGYYNNHSVIARLHAGGFCSV